MRSVPLCGQTELSWGENLSIIPVKETGCTEPVSYTHLDVYKRQVCDPVRSDMLCDPVCKEWICVEQETSLSDTVCLVVEFLRHHFIEDVYKRQQ